MGGATCTSVRLALCSRMQPPLQPCEAPRYFHFIIWIAKMPLHPRAAFSDLWAFRSTAKIAAPVGRTGRQSSRCWPWCCSLTSMNGGRSDTTTTTTTTSEPWTAARGAKVASWWQNRFHASPKCFEELPPGFQVLLQFLRCSRLPRSAYSSKTTSGRNVLCIGRSMPCFAKHLGSLPVCLISACFLEAGQFAAPHRLTESSTTPRHTSSADRFPCAHRQHDKPSNIAGISKSRDRGSAHNPPPEGCHHQTTEPTVVMLHLGDG
ncbi:hypothetical protein BKA63DRAFT_491152 [Paraphoma chrysanthemicola]|nr:hypothetical protein BKA63DRAFT_491152 [Paraphoma chrysanthemicola]